MTDIYLHFVYIYNIDREHDTQPIENMLNKCDSSIVYFTHKETELSIPSLCHLILPQVPINLNQVYDKQLFEMLKSLQTFQKMELVDGIILIIAEYMKDAQFVLELKPKPQSIFNANYYCDIKKVSLSKHFISIDIQENGDMSLGAIQNPTMSKIKSKNLAKKQGLKIKYCSFYKYNTSKQVYGVLTYEWKDLHKASIQEMFDIEFSYGWSGYEYIKLFNTENKNHQKFIKHYLEYYQT